MEIPRIDHGPTINGGKPCICGLRVAVGGVLELLASGQRREQILQVYPYLEPEDIQRSSGLCGVDLASVNTGW